MKDTFRYERKARCCNSLALVYVFFPQVLGNRSSRKEGRGKGKPSPLLLEASKHSDQGPTDLAIILGSFRDHFGARLVLESIRGQRGINLGSFWVHFRATLE